ncbi:MAG: stalk domain-containing protein [Defluviitaleaceae bacterium]|nr:stalk domain-containing protein [Defluviitaleaceae bacterium]
MQKFLKRFQIKGFAAGFLVCALLSGTLVWANTGGAWREVFYGVNVVVDGVPQNFPPDMTPFIADGRTFLPVRGIADVFDVPVEWYGATRTVYLGTIPHGFPFLSVAPNFEGEAFNNLGLRITGGGPHIRNVQMLGQPHANSMIAPQGQGAGARAWSHHSLNAQFTELTGLIGRIDGQGGTSVISFLGDGRELASFSVDANTIPHEISVDVRGVLVLRVQINGNSIAFTNAMIQ